MTIFPQPGTEMYTLYTEEDGFKIRGGWNVMSATNLEEK